MLLLLLLALLAVAAVAAVVAVVVAAGDAVVSRVSSVFCKTDVAAAAVVVALFWPLTEEGVRQQQ